MTKEDPPWFGPTQKEFFDIMPSSMAKNASPTLKLSLFLSNFLGLIFVCDVPENPLLDERKTEL